MRESEVASSSDKRKRKKKERVRRRINFRQEKGEKGRESPKPRINYYTL